MSERKSHRRRRVARRPHPPAYLVSLGTVAVLLSLTALVVVLAQPEWSSSLFGQPFGAYALGALGALLTLAISYKWPARMANTHPVRVMGCTTFRLLSASLLGGLGHALVAALVMEGGTAWTAAFVFGLAEKPLNDLLLGRLGLVTPPEKDGSRADRDRLRSY